MKQNVDIEGTLSLEDYIEFEEKGEVRHEFYNGKLFAMPGETLLHNKMCIKVLILLKTLLGTDWEIYMESVKVNIENERIYLYPDIMVKKIGQGEAHPFADYIIYNPILITEILSDSTRKYDLTDKFIQYQKISSLKYYLLVEPAKQVIIVNEKDESGEWSAKIYTELEEIIQLPLFQTSFSLGQVYQPS